MRMLTSRYDNIREHIMSMSAKFKGMDMALSNGFIVHFIMTSLPTEFFFFFY
jgi:hypothetical protein